MLLWGLVWGAVFGALWGGFGTYLVPGAILGAVAGYTLRRAMRGEVARMLQQQAGAAAPRPVEAARPDVPPALVPQPARPPEAAAGAAMASGVAVEPAGVTAPVAPADEWPDPAADAGPRNDAMVRLVARARAWLLGGNTVLRVGVVVLFVGLSFLVKYAAEHALVPLELRLAGAGASGIALLAAGFRVRSRRAEYGMTLQGAGVAVLYLTVFASYRLFHLLPGSLAFALMVAVCGLSSAIALMQNAQVLAFVGFAGGFLAPVLASTGEGSHVALFAYFALLDAAIVVIALRRAWRGLNLLGFVATFGISTAWGVLRYRPENYASTQPFLILFFLMFVAAALLYARHHATRLTHPVDGTLVFGTPVLAFGLQAALTQPFAFGPAFSALALGAFYLGLSRWQLARGEGARPMAESFLALGVGFATLAVPLALDGRWTAAVWAVEGAGVFWVGTRQGRPLARAFAVLLQVLAMCSFLSALDQDPVAAWPVAHPACLGALLLALAAMVIAWLARAIAPGQAGPLGRTWLRLERRLSSPLFVYGFACMMLAWVMELRRVLPGADASWVQPAVPHAMRGSLAMLAFVVSASICARIAVRLDWKTAAWPAWFTAPVLLLAALDLMDGGRFRLALLPIWAVAAVLHVLLLRRVDGEAPLRWLAWAHAMGVWVVGLLLAQVLYRAIEAGALWRSGWDVVVLLTAATVTLIGLTLWTGSARWLARWPLVRFDLAYAFRGALPVALVAFVGALAVAMFSDGTARPLPYLPVLNPTDLSVMLAFGAIVLWLLRLWRDAERLPRVMHGSALRLVLAVAMFIAVNTVWLRIVHHYRGVPWRVDHLFESALVQAGCALLWTLLALVLMLLGHRRALRSIWMAGAAVLALTVAKLVLVDLSNAGGSERIFAFIGVGALMLVVGYFAPLPPPGGSLTAATAGEGTS